MRKPQPDLEKRYDDDTILLGRPAFAGWLRRRVEGRRPSAIVRIGDGEEALLDATL